MLRLDRYILRQFINTFAFGILAFVVIYVVVDLIEHLSTFIDRKVPGDQIILYYLTSLPDILTIIVPIAVLLSSLFTVSRLDASNELTAMRAGGWSMKRIAAPILAAAVMVSAGMIYFTGWIAPMASKSRYAVDRKYMGGSLTGNVVGGQRNIALRLSPKVNMLIDYFDPATRVANQVAIEKFAFDTPVDLGRMSRPDPAHATFSLDTVRALRIVERIDAKRMTYDSVRRVWVLHDGVARNSVRFPLVNDTAFSKQDAPPIPLTPEEMNLAQRNTRELTNDELWERIEQERMSGRDVRRLSVDYYAKYSFPFAAFIVALFGVSFSSSQRKSGAAMQVAATAVISAVYLILSEATKAISAGSDIHPAIVAWLANAVFFLAGLANLIRVERG